MLVKELIAQLQQMPPDAEAMLAYDGALRTHATAVWLAQNGWVGIGPVDDPLYYTEDRPAGAPSEAQNPYWRLSDAQTPTP